MLTDITLGQYYPGSSYLHRLDPRVKIVAVFVLVICTFTAETYWSYLLLTGFTALAAVLSRIPGRLLFKAVRPLWMIIILTLVVNLLSLPGTVIYSWGPFTVTMEGLRQGLLMAARLVFLIITASLLTFTTSPLSLTDGLEILLRPGRRFGIPAHELAMMMTIALRFIPTLLEETERIMKAQTARGADFSSGNLVRRGKNMVPLLVPLFVSAFRRADELATAMEARCYRGAEGRTRMRILKIAARDYIALLAVGAVTIALIALRIIYKAN